MQDVGANRKTAQELQSFVDRHGSIDRTGKNESLSRDCFRQECRDGLSELHLQQKGSDNSANPEVGYGVLDVAQFEPPYDPEEALAAVNAFVEPFVSIVPAKDWHA